MPKKVSLPAKDDFRKCFGCGKDNPAGLKLSFSWDGEKAEADFTPGELHQGWPGIMHGGLICCLLDEAMAYVAYFHGYKGLTARTQVRLHAPLSIGEPLHITGKVVRLTRKLIETAALVTMRDGSKGAESQAVIFLTEKTDAAKTPAHRESCGALIEGYSPARAVLWDMDGVIVDTARYHFKSWQEAFSSRGVTFTAANFQHGFGQRNDNIIRSVMGQDVPLEEMEAIARDKESSFRRRIDGNIQPFSGAAELIRSLHQRGFRQAITSSAPMENIRSLLEPLDLLKYFQAVVSGRDVARGKPDPQVFLAAAQKLQVKPENCLVIEDAVAGVQAARAAGMKSIAVTNSHPRDSLAEADLVVDSLSEVDTGAIERILCHPTMPV
ncbi:MAG: tRNA threonylcarbamoyl adenosine modification protein YeaZ [Dehalococcoidia bacterium]|nr:tRNA threonylcarbamoyl adenosine modification protein YeaZ [Dehalococcoidia bacterium]